MKIIINTNTDTDKDNLIIKITNKPKLLHLPKLLQQNDFTKKEIEKVLKPKILHLPKLLHLPKILEQNDCTKKEIEKVLIWTNI